MREWLKRIWPVSTKEFQCDIHQLDERQEKQAAHTQQQLNALSERLTAAAAEQARMSIAFTAAADKLEKLMLSVRREAREAVWASVFHDATAGSRWLEQKSFSPGRWAVGYQALYAIYRILDEARPKRILEIGLGQSTRMISRFAAAFEDVEHTVVESDPEWIAFFTGRYPLCERTQVVRLDTEMSSYRDARGVRVFKGFREALEGKTFDFICIDAPLASDMKQYGRVDLLSILPDCLADDFIIAQDDGERAGEKKAMAEMEAVLQANDITYHKGNYVGANDFIVLCSENRKFFKSM